MTKTHLPADAERTLSVAMADVDGDGDLDLLFGNTTDRAAGERDRLYRNDGTGHFTDVSATHLPQAPDGTLPFAVAFADIDGDGDADLLLGGGKVPPTIPPSFVGQQNLLWVNDGTGHFTDVTATRLPALVDTTLALAVGDVDGDGDLDVVFGDESQQDRLLLNDGTGTFAEATTTRMPKDNAITRGVALGDVDGDGDLDLVLGNGYPGSGARLYANDGTGTFADVTVPDVFHTALPAVPLALLDVEEDGDLDVLAGGLFVNDGTGHFTDESSRIGGSCGGLSLAVGDTDGDGDQDLVSGTSGFCCQTSNLLRQIESRGFPVTGKDWVLDAYARYGVSASLTTALPFLAVTRSPRPWPPYGTFGFDPAVTIVLPPFAVAQPAGVGTLTIHMPKLTNVSGITLYAQALLLTPPPYQGRLTNVLARPFLR